MTWAWCFLNLQILRLFHQKKGGWEGGGGIVQSNSSEPHLDLNRIGNLGATIQEDGEGWKNSFVLQHYILAPKSCKILKAPLPPSTQIGKMCLWLKNVETEDLSKTDSQGTAQMRTQCNTKAVVLWGFQAQTGAERPSLHGQNFLKPPMERNVVITPPLLEKS